MIDFALEAEHLMVEKLVRDWAGQKIAPRIQELDRAAHFDRSILAEMAELGLLGLCIPESYGGAGMDYISLGLACEELEYVDTFLRVILSVHVGLNSMTMMAWATEEQKQHYLVPQARGTKLATYALTEPNAGSDAVGIQATARRDGTDYLLNGEKMWISLADVADHFITFAWTDQEKRAARDHAGITGFILERGMPGLTTGTIHGKLGIRAGNTGFLSFNDVRVPAGNVLGEPGEGFKIAMFALDQGRYTVAAGATGLVRACLDASVKYARERHSFGQPIGQHQLVKELIADMSRNYEASRLLYQRAGWMKNQGLRNTRETAVAKWYACDASEKAAADAVEVHGAYGYSDEYPVERFYRNCKAAVIYEGSREIQKLIAADYALGYRVDRPMRAGLPSYPFSG
ncbi:MAG TPA: butyryl-CoA dehydrogenase [Clostridiales bacterium UBA8153]|nr:butyryl-CoA dehydrogenase [Clostridiales bacterium UBA8153]